MSNLRTGDAAVLFDVLENPLLLLDWLEAPLANIGSLLSWTYG
ncbi:MAG: hypothetical protein N0A16_13355 [Blastocatellia bacterium]|nr:hypothetical protein [Blastocatellia bacterium]